MLLASWDARGTEFGESEGLMSLTEAIDTRASSHVPLPFHLQAHRGMCPHRTIAPRGYTRSFKTNTGTTEASVEEGRPQPQSFPSFIFARQTNFFSLMCKPSCCDPGFIENHALDDLLGLLQKRGIAPEWTRNAKKSETSCTRSNLQRVGSGLDIITPCCLL
jgi:hypothetical protein